jgi:hypothetical protein
MDQQAIDQAENLLVDELDDAGAIDPSIIVKHDNAVGTQSRPDPAKGVTGRGVHINIDMREAETTVCQAVSGFFGEDPLVQERVIKLVLG